MSEYSAVPSAYKFQVYAAGVFENKDRMNSINYDLREPQKTSPFFRALKHAVLEIPQNRR